MHLPPSGLFKTRNFIFYVTSADVLWSLFPQAFECKAHSGSFSSLISAAAEVTGCSFNPTKGLFHVCYGQSPQHWTRNKTEGRSRAVVPPDGVSVLCSGGQGSYKGNSAGLTVLDDSSCHRPAVPLVLVDKFSLPWLTAAKRLLNANSLKHDSSLKLDFFVCLFNLKQNQVV